ncbi:hypothetical protein AVEN_134019-1 [Araneus ventricosus]|uniref:Uncharacterized protein n=1 Tax=Araneus ventricosus TaxID=182803 RepID=A0A4Y2MW79_ARAVE|nr:hypothetical protein AVEN_134019-1 [Araneus ventricosus]
MGPIHGLSSVESGFEPGALRPHSRDLSTRPQRPWILHGKMSQFDSTLPFQGKCMIQKCLKRRIHNSSVIFFIKRVDSRSTVKMDMKKFGEKHAQIYNQRTCEKLPSTYVVRLSFAIAW